MKREREHKRRIQRMIPLLIFGAVVLLIAKEEIPAVDNWISRLLDAEAWNAGEACRRAALADMEPSGYIRATEDGEVERTQAGFYVGGIEYAMLQSSGEELRVRYSCNVSQAGEVVALNRQESGSHR